MRFLARVLDIVLISGLPPILAMYERWFMYRVREAWGKVHLKNIKNKGRNVRIVGYSRFLDADNIALGDGVQIGYGCFFFGKGGITIGDNTIISRNVTIYSANHDYSSDTVPYNGDYNLRPVSIGRSVWIGMGVTIVPGIRIADGAIVGMGTVVAKDIGEGEIVVGASQRVVSRRDLDDFYKNHLKGSWFSNRFPNG